MEINSSILEPWASGEVGCEKTSFRTRGALQHHRVWPCWEIERRIRRSVRGMLDDCWDAIACHSGDCGFELLFGIEMATTLTEIMPHGELNSFLNMSNILLR